MLGLFTLRAAWPARYHLVLGTSENLASWPTAARGARRAGVPGAGGAARTLPLGLHRPDAPRVRRGAPALGLQRLVELYARRPSS